MSTDIIIDKNSDVGRGVTRFLGMAREAAMGLNGQIAILQTMLEGDGTQAAHFAKMVSRGYAPTNENAKASFDALVTLSSQFAGLTTAVITTCARHGV